VVFGAIEIMVKFYYTKKDGDIGCVGFALFGLGILVMENLH
jgi:hypothetical protein